jgi:AcrR family transcriptional regulator
MGATRGTYTKGRERREAILQASSQAFAEHGYRAASLAKIARRAGVSDAGLLHHFPSKKQLLLAVLEARDQQDLERVLGAVDAQATFADALLQLCAENTAAPALVQLFAVMAAESIEAEHPGHELFLARYERLRTDVSALLAAAQQRGEIDAGLDAELVAPQLIALLDGLQLQWLLHPQDIDMVALLRDFLDHLRPRG